MRVFRSRIVVVIAGSAVLASSFGLTAAASCSARHATTPEVGH
jgi:hypothetical protein